MTLIPPTELRQDLTGRNRLMRVGRIQYTFSIKPDGAASDLLDVSIDQYLSMSQRGTGSHAALWLDVPQISGGFCFHGMPLRGSERKTSSAASSPRINCRDGF
jgi:hypothetical protein